MAVIYLIRHGQASAGAKDYDKLSPLGEQQARLLAPVLAAKSASPNKIIRGDMLRHQQTAFHAISCPHLSKSIQTDTGWNEYDHRAILAGFHQDFHSPAGIKEHFIKHGLTQHDFKEIFMKAVSKWINNEQSANASYPETWQQFQQRVQTSFKNLCDNAQGVNFVITSGGPISLLTSKLLGLPLTEFMHINWQLVNGGITKVLINGKTEQISLSSLNEHSHFEQADKLLTYT